MKLCTCLTTRESYLFKQSNSKQLWCLKKKKIIDVQMKFSLYCTDSFLDSF